MGNDAAVLIVASLLNIKCPLLTSVPPFIVNGASNWSVPSVSTTVIVPLFWANELPAIVAVPAGLPPMPPVAPLSMPIVPPAPRIQAAEMSSLLACAIVTAPLKMSAS
jgi:hypothetical protein